MLIVLMGSKNILIAVFPALYSYKLFLKLMPIAFSDPEELQADYNNPTLHPTLESSLLLLSQSF